MDPLGLQLFVDSIFGGLRAAAPYAIGGIFIILGVYGATR